MAEKLPIGQAARNSLYCNFRTSSRHRKKEFTLSKEEFNALTSSNCYYCDASPSLTHMQKGYNGAYVYNGLDRLDNTLGYTKDNCVPSCLSCNMAKGTKTFEQFQVWLEKVYLYQKQKRT